jgi:type I restriction enzyme R subunit
LVYELDPDGKQMRVVRFTDITAEKVRTLYRNVAELRQHWADPQQRRDIIERLADRGIDFDELAEVAEQPDADPLASSVTWHSTRRCARDGNGRDG